MNNLKNIKIVIGISYILIILIFLWFFFKYFSIEEFTSYQLIKENIEILIRIKQNNLLISGILFVVFAIIWIFLLGFALPIFLFGGFLFGKWIGFLLVIFSLSFGATLFYIFANFFLKEIIQNYLSSKYSYLILKFKKNEFLYFLVYRFVGGIPFFISNLIPVLFNVKVRNFFFGSLIGMSPQIFVATSFAAGLEKVLTENIEPPTFFEILFVPDIYIPLIGFFILLIISLIIKKFYNRY